MVAGAMVGAYQYMDTHDNEVQANAFLKAAYIQNGFEREQFKKEHPELLEKAVPVYNAMEKGLRDSYGKDGHHITQQEEKQIDITMCNIAQNIAEIIKEHGPGMEGKNVADELGRGSHAECAAGV